MILEQTRRDPVLAPIVQFLQQGWPNVQGKDPQLAPFFNRKDELSLYEGYILWGTRVVVPTAHQDAVLIARIEAGTPYYQRAQFSHIHFDWS